MGPKFTWFRGSTKERLNRGLALESWRLIFSEAFVRHLPRIRSNHRPLLVNFAGLEIPNRVQCPFRFIIPWMSHPDFQRLVNSSWKAD
ncbi:hypothetical protein LINPERHAP2_LOCUS15744 [Linum perenne]